MGGWGKSSDGSRYVKAMDFEPVGYVKGFRNHSDVKVLLQQTGSNNLTTTGSFTGDTIYIALDKKTKELDHIYYFKNHKLVKSIDMRETCGPHYHYWFFNEDGDVYRPRHKKDNTFTDFSPEDLHYIQEGDKFAKEYISKISNK